MKFLIISCLFAVASIAKSKTFHCDDGFNITMEEDQIKSHHQLIENMKKINCKKLDQSLINYGEDNCFSSPAEKTTFVMVNNTNNGILRYTILNNTATATFCISF